MVKDGSWIRLGELTSNAREQKLNLEKLGWYRAGDLAFSFTVTTKYTPALLLKKTIIK